MSIGATMSRRVAVVLANVEIGLKRAVSWEVVKTLKHRLELAVLATEDSVIFLARRRASIHFNGELCLALKSGDLPGKMQEVEADQQSVVLTTNVIPRQVTHIVNVLRPATKVQHSTARVLQDMKVGIQKVLRLRQSDIEHRHIEVQVQRKGVKEAELQNVGKAMKKEVDAQAKTVAGVLVSNAVGAVLPGEVLPTLIAAEANLLRAVAV